MLSQLIRTATHCNTVPHTAIHCDTLQHAATHGNTLRHTVTVGQVMCKNTYFVHTRYTHTLSLSHACTHTQRTHNALATVVLFLFCFGRHWLARFEAVGMIGKMCSRGDQRAVTAIMGTWKFSKVINRVICHGHLCNEMNLENF